MNKKNTAPAPKLSVPTSIFNFTFNIKCVILAALAFGFYINTVNNKYALDDSLVITDNKYVQQGFSGIKHIFTSDAFDNYVKEMHGSEASASSGRWYRPLPMAIFAVEQGLFGDSPSLRHLINVLFFMLCSIAIFYFFSKYLFIAIPYGEDISFIAAFLFVIHPIHTEAVANIKSLDEIISLLFVVCTFIFSLAYSRNKKTWLLLLSLVSFLLALLSKEYAITLIILLPILFYLLITTDLKKLLRLILPFYAIIVLYGLIRISAVGIPHSMLSTDILTNPYLFATSSQQLATECYVLGKYFLLLIFPHTLSCDYSFSQIPYHNFASISVWVSIFFYIALIVWGIWLLSKKNILAFPVFFYLFNIFIISNLVMGFGTMMGERLIYGASMSFVIFPAYAMVQISAAISLSVKKVILGSLMGLLLIACGKEVIERNKQWKDDDTLFIADIHSAPNSFMVNNNLGAYYIRAAQFPNNKAISASLIDSAYKYTYKSIILHKTPYVNSIINMGMIYYLKQMPDSSKFYCDSAAKLFNNLPTITTFLPLLANQYLQKGMQLSSKGEIEKGVDEIKKALRIDHNNANIWYNLGGGYYTLKRFDSARYCWDATLLLKPDYTEAKQGLAALPKQIKDTVKGIR